MTQSHFVLPTGLFNRHILLSSIPLSIQPTNGFLGYNHTDDRHFITLQFATRGPLLGRPRHRDLFLTILEEVRRRYALVVVGYVVMPEHVHVLLDKPRQRKVPFVKQVLKQRVAVRSLDEGLL